MQPASLDALHWDESEKATLVGRGMAVGLGDVAFIELQAEPQAG